MKNNSLGTKLLMVALMLAVLSYFCVQAVNYFSDPLTTTLVHSYQVEESVPLSGYVVRSERVLESGASGSLLQLRRAEGERVSTGGTVAMVYADQASLDRQNEIAALETRVEQLQYARETALGSEASLKLDAQILQGIVAVRSGLAQDRLDVAEDAGADLRTLIMKRDYTYSGTEDISAQLTDLQTQLKRLKSQAAGSVRHITAPESGLYSAVVDGYESVLTPESLTAMTPSQLAAIRADGTARSEVGKLVLGDCWYYAAAMNTADAKKLRDTAAELERAGKSLELHFSKSVERSLSVTVDALGPEENGRVVVIFKGRNYLPELTLLRQQSAEVVSNSLEGIRVPKEALRAQRITVDKETGERTVTEEMGIYCVVGVEARFKPVEVLYNGDGFVLVRAGETEKSTRILRSGDEVIISANDLFDGKIVGEAN